MKIIIAGGGTGGHLYPGVALAQELRRLDPGGEVIFVGARKKLTEQILAHAQFEFRPITVKRLAGGSIWEKLGSLFILPLALWQCWRIISRFDPQAVIGMGGYASGPMVMITSWRKRRCFIQEQNMEPGKANFWASVFADKVFVSYEATAQHFSEEKVIVTGNPVRAEFNTKLDKRQARQQFGLDADKFTVLVFGGSQGAHRLNVGMTEALGELVEQKDNLQIIHQTGERDYPQVAQAYGQSDLRSHVAAFIHNMPQAYAAADLIICRSGATTMSELAAASKPAILVPYPFAAADHQLKNAACFAKEGACQIILDGQAKGPKLAKTILELMGDKKKLNQMAAASRKLARPDAARKMAEEILKG